jgi:hypothetical protein
MAPESGLTLDLENLTLRNFSPLPQQHLLAYSDLLNRQITIQKFDCHFIGLTQLKTQSIQYQTAMESLVVDEQRTGVELTFNRFTTPPPKP